MKNPRDEFIDNLILKVPNMKVLWLDQKNNKRWSTEKILSELTKEERGQFNLRKQFSDEIILDIEEKYKLDDIKRKLLEKNWSYKIWDTGSRGYHISLIFENLGMLSIELRNRIRKYVIQYFETDEKLAKESQWLALEYTPHMKTGNIKTLNDFNNLKSTNVIDNTIIEYCKLQLENEKKSQTENKQILKDYNKSDPYLKYAMENVITSGDRNNILFKNLAIGLVQSNLTRKEILPYAEQVIANCTGKSVGEFMGWVDKALKGMMNDYNKTELVQWSLNYNHPILYKLYDNEELIDFMTIKQLWDEIWNHKISSQEVWKDLCFYNMLGTIINEKEDDYRVHVIFASDSGTGKDEGINLVRDILERLEYNTKKPSTITDKTLVGGINQSSIDFNVKWQLSEDEPVKGNKVWRSPVENGFLEDTDWMAFGESEFILKPSAYNKHIQLILRQAMDKDRRIDKGVAGYEIKIKTNTSFVMVTYSMDNIIHSVLHNGLFQRALFYNKSLKSNEHDKIRTFISEKSFKPIMNNPFNEKKYISKLLEKLRVMKQWYYENRNKFDFEESSGDMVNKLWKEFEGKYSTFFNEDKKILNSIIRRSVNNLQKLTILGATYKMKTFVSKNLIKEQFQLISKCVDSVRHLIVNQDKGKKRMYMILQLVSKGGVTKGMIHKELEDTFNMSSPNTRTNFIKKLIETKYATTFKLGRSETLALTEKGRNYLIFEED